MSGVIALLVVCLLVVFIAGVSVISTNKSSQKQIKAQNEAARNEDLQQYFRQKRIAEARGLEKYYIMHNEEVENYEKGVRAMRQLGYLMESSVVQEREKDWAIRGGIADGLAGPIAGVAVALGTMKDNEEIRARNAANREWGAQQRHQMNALADKAESDKPARLSMYDIRSLYAAVFSWSPKTLFRKISFFDISTEQNKRTGSVTVTAKWKIPKLSVVIDGTIRAKLYNGNMKCVGCAFLNLPKTGTLDKEGTLTGICINLPLADYYTVQLEPVDLWEFTASQYKDYPGDDNISSEEHIKIVQEYESRYKKELEG